MDYEFDRMPTKRPPRFTVQKIAIFCTVLAVTGGVIYWIIPSKPAKKATTTTTTASSPASQASGAASAGNATSTSTAAGEASGATAKKADPTAAEKATTPVAETNPAPTEKPVKGVPWSGDPAVDVPEKPIDAGQAATEQQLSQNNWQMIEAGAAPWCVAHTVAKGENLERLATHYHTTVALLKEMNHLKGNTIFLGKKMKVVPGPWRIEISKSARRLQLFNLANSKTLFAAYDVGIGRADSTPADEFVISIRLFHPKYYAPNGAIFAYGDPGNPLGDYFLKLATSKQKDRPLAGYGIHGSPDDEGVGRSLSHGCVRMRNADVRQLYLLCPTGTPVVIVE